MMIDGYSMVRPHEVLTEMAVTLPEEVKENIIIIGSLAAASRQPIGFWTGQG